MKKLTLAPLATLCLVLFNNPMVSGQIDMNESARLNIQGNYQKMRLILPFDTEEHEYMVEKIGRYYVLNGDIVVGDDLQRTRLNQKVPPAIPGVPSSAYLWPNGRMPIVVDPSVYEYDMDWSVRAAIAEINNRVSNLCLVSHDNEADYVRLVISPELGSAGGVSPIGRQGGEQVVAIAPNQAPRVIAHELLHSLGFYHEQSRTDRDNFVSFNVENIEAKKAYNFQMEGGSKGLGAYDYCSIMHYPANAFAWKAGLTTITCRQNGQKVDCPDCMGKSPGLSDGDVQGLNSAYQFSQKLLPCAGRINMEPTWNRIGGVSFSNQEAVAYDYGKVAVLTYGTDNEVYSNNWNGYAWSDWQKANWGTKPVRSLIKAVKFRKGEIAAFLVDGNGHLWVNYWQEGSTWQQNWKDLGGSLTGEFDVVSWSDNRLDVFARNKAGGLDHLYLEGVWKSWETVLADGVQTGATVEVDTWARGRLDIFVVKSDNSLQHCYFDNNNWGPWEPLGGNVAGKMSVVSFAPGHLDIFCEGSDKGVWHRYFDRTTWSDWHPLGFKMDHSSELEAVAWGGNRIDLFVKGPDKLLYHAYWAGGDKWSAFERIGKGRMNSSPAVATWGANRLDIFALGPDNSVRQMYWDGLKWGL
ncbi:MAG: hypothetical protein IPL65_21850 [Lewinellaceae bacterium]|nr:hypothetical protein [Lewinellaceae bacterium]